MSPVKLKFAARRGLTLAPAQGGTVAHTVTGPYASSDPHATTVLTQLHCHTTQSDGSYSPADVVQYYINQGYGALQITDHDLATTQPAGMTTAITGVEHSPTTQHIIATNSDYLRGSTTDAQTILDAIAADGGKAHIAHPKWSVGMTYAEMAGLSNFMGHEIHNAHCVDGAGQNPVTYPGYAIDRWDDLLSGSRRDLWGLSVDDMHVIGTYDTFNVGRLQVFAETNTPANVVAAIASGNFVADVSNYGVTPGFPTRSVADLSVSCTGAVRIEARGAGGLLTSTVGTSHTHTFDGSERYVRLVAVGDYTEPFAATLSDRWVAVDGTWTVTGGVLALSTDGTARRLILRRHRQGDFDAQVDVKLSSGGLDGAALMFNVLNGNYYYMLRIGESTVTGYNNQLAVAKTTSNGFANNSQLDNAAFDPTAGTWYTLKMTYAAGRIRGKVWERGTSEPDWMVDVTDATWKHGTFGFRANRTTQYDNLYISGFETFYQPVAID